MDTVIQQGRQAIGGVVELRGNGALLNRKSLDECGGFNEDTVTDDLDLSFRLLTLGFSVGILWDPPVEEEGVESLNALIRQRKRWAEGGLQRFFDYWPFLTSNRLNISQNLDLTAFFLLQYALPVTSFVVGKSSGAVGFAAVPGAPSGILKLTQTNGKFQAGEALQINGIDFPVVKSKEDCAW